MSVSPLKVAEAPYKPDMLKALDDIRAEIEDGTTVALVVVAIHVDSKFRVIQTGDIMASQLAGVLGRAHLDVLEDMRKDG